MSTKDYRPWERPRPAGLCADCGHHQPLTENGLCHACSTTRETAAWAPAFPSPLSGGQTEPDSKPSSLPAVARPTGSAGAGNFADEPRRSRDAW